MTLFKQKYRVETARLRGWDYAAAGWYFVTLCTRGGQHFFGEVVGGEMRLTDVGEVVAEEWCKTPSLRPNVELDEWIIMPNHLHGIIVINSTHVETTQRVVSTKAGQVVSTNAGRVVSTKARLKPGSLGAIIGQFNSICTKRIWTSGQRAFAWQPGFYDHIIRSEKSLANIRRYIANNPAKWKSDRNNPAELWM